MPAFPIISWMSKNLQHIKSWFKKGFFAILDQGLFGTANFLVNILLARWLEPDQYGAFAVAYSVFLLLAAFHTAVLTEPMMIFGAGKYATEFRKYIGILIYGHWITTGIIAIILGLTALVFWKVGSNSMAQTIAGLAVASPFIVLMWFARRVFYVCFRPYWPCAGSALYFVLMILAVFLLSRAELLSPSSALITMGVAGLVPSVGLLLVLHPRLRFTDGNPTPTMVLNDHWEYGRWNILATGVFWASGQIHMIFVPIFLGLHTAAVIAAVLNLFRPLNLLMQSATLLVLPALASLASKKASQVLLRHKAKRLIILFAGAAFLYGILITGFADFILHYLYAGKYDGYGILVFLFTLGYTASASTQILTMVLKSTGNTRSVVFIWGISALIVTVMSIPMMMLWGVNGAILVVVVSYFVAASAAWKKVKLMEASP